MTDTRVAHTKKSNLQQCKNYRTISLICHPRRQASDQDAVRRNRFSILGFCVRGTSNVNKTFIVSLLILKRRSAEYGIKPFGLL